MNKQLQLSSRITELLSNNKRYYFVYLFFGILGWTLAYINTLQNEWVFSNQHVILLITLIISYFTFAYSFTLPKLLLKHEKYTKILLEFLPTTKKVAFIYIAYVLVTMIFSMLLANTITFFELSLYGVSAPLFMNQKLTLVDTFILSSLQPIKNLLEACLSNVFLFYAPFFYALKGDSALKSVHKGISFFFKNLRFSLFLTIVLILNSEIIRILPVTNLWTIIYIPISAYILITIFIVRLIYFQDHSKILEKT